MVRANQSGAVSAGYCRTMESIAIAVTPVVVVIGAAAPGEAVVPVLRDVADVLLHLLRVRLELGVSLEGLFELSGHRERPRPQHRLGRHPHAPLPPAAARAARPPPAPSARRRGRHAWWPGTSSPVSGAGGRPRLRARRPARTS